VARTKPPPQAFPKPTRTERLKTEREEREREILARGELRHEVLKRAGERCESCGADLHVAGFVFDHWLGGNGRRKAEERIDTTWALCLACNQARTDNDPSAEHWNERFERHCQRHGYPSRPHVTTTILDAFVGALRRKSA
jgi:hypothetical protein